MPKFLKPLGLKAESLSTNRVSIDNQTMLFHMSDNMGIRRFYRNLLAFQRQHSPNSPFLVSRISRVNSGLRQTRTSKVFEFISESAFKLSNKFFFRIAFLINAHNVKNANVIVSTYYFKNYLDFYLKSSKKLIVVVFDMIPEMHGRKYPELRYAHANKLDYMKCASTIVCISDYTKSCLLLCHPELSEKKIEVVTPFVSIDTSAKVVAGVPHHDEFIRVLYIGKRGFYKNFDEILKSLAKNTGRISLIVVGSSPFSTQEISLIERAKKKGHLISLALAPTDREMSEIFIHVDFVVISSLSEGFGYPAYEGTLAGVPVLAKTCQVWDGIPYVYQSDSLDVRSLENFYTKIRTIDRSAIQLKAKRHVRKLNAKAEKNWIRILANV